jgi:hypothetical protein
VRQRGASLVLVAFFVFLVLPLYALTAVLVIRSDVLSVSSGDLTDEQLKAMWTFIASGLATAATVLGAILTKSHNDRSLAFQQETEQRKHLLELETAERMRLETVVSGINLLNSSGSYSPKAVTAGGLATLVELGHPPIAIRVLAAALEDDAVDRDTAAWLLSKALLGTSPQSVEEAAGLLVLHAKNFTTPDEPGFFSWPDCLTAHWIHGLSANAGMNVINGLGELLLSQNRDWWQDSWTWVVYTLDEALLYDPDPGTKMLAAAWAAQLLEYVDEGVYIAGIKDARAKQEVKARVEAQGFDPVVLEWLPTDRITHWGTVRNWQTTAPHAKALPAAVPADKETTS